MTPALDPSRTRDREGPKDFKSFEASVSSDVVAAGPRA
jgi:hypothetical protein